MTNLKKVTTAIRLQQIMDEQGLKQVDIVRKCEPYSKKFKIKIGRNDISQYVAGKVVPGQAKIFILSEALKVSEPWLMGYDVPQQKHTNFDDITSDCQSLNDETIPLYKKLDTEDKAEIKGTIKQMLKAEKYNNRPIVKVAAHDGSTRKVRDIPVTEMIKRELKKKSNKK